jgi:phage-related tail protein
MSGNLRLQLVLETLNRASAPLRQITNDSTRTGQALRANRVAMRGLQRQQADISSFQRLRRATNESSTQLAEARRTVERLQQQLQTTAAPTARLRREFEQARTAAARLETTHAGNRRQLMNVRSSLISAGVSTGNLSSEQTRLTSQVAQANTAIQQQQQRLSTLAAQQRRNNQLTEMSNRGAMAAAKGAAAMYAGQRALGGMMGLMDEGIDFDAAMSRVQALTG